MIGFLLPSLWCGAYVNQHTDHYSNINIKESQVQGAPKGSSIQATIDGHYLTIVFLENLGQVHVVVTTDTGGEVDAVFTETPNGLCIYIPNTGSFIVTFTLPNGDEYYGEFEVRE
jgi:hypothetical protein